MTWLTIPGEPQHKPTIRSRTWKKWRRWADGVVVDAIAQGILLGPGREPRVLWVACFFAMPKSWSAKKRAAMAGQPMFSKPDTNHLWNGLADALYGRDERIADQRCIKAWASDDGRGPRMVAWLGELTIEPFPQLAAETLIDSPRRPR